MGRKGRVVGKPLNVWAKGLSVAAVQPGQNVTGVSIMLRTEWHPEFPAANVRFGIMTAEDVDRLCVVLQQQRNLAWPEFKA